MASQQLLMGGPAEHEQVEDLATSIRNQQRREIRQMRRWYADWFDGDGGGMGPGMHRGPGR